MSDSPTWVSPPGQERYLLVPGAFVWGTASELENARWLLAHRLYGHVLDQRSWDAGLELGDHFLVQVVDEPGLWDVLYEQVAGATPVLLWMTRV